MEKDYYLTINGERIAVSKEIYDAYIQPIWREKKRRDVRADREFSYDAITDSGVEIPSRERLIEDIVEDKMLLEALLAALSSLAESERALIEQLYFGARSEQQIADETGIPRKTINNRRRKILDKLAKFLKGE